MSFLEHADIEAYRGYISDYMLYVVFLSHHGNLIKSMYCSSLCLMKNNKQYINSLSLKSSTNSQQKCTPTGDHIKIILETIILINIFLYSNKKLWTGLYIIKIYSFSNNYIWKKSALRRTAMLFCQVFTVIFNSFGIFHKTK